MGTQRIGITKPQKAMLKKLVSKGVSPQECVNRFSTVPPHVVMAAGKVAAIELGLIEDDRPGKNQKPKTEAQIRAEVMEELEAQQKLKPSKSEEELRDEIKAEVLAEILAKQAEAAEAAEKAVSETPVKAKPDPAAGKR
jgi:hypothetical protein